MFDNNNTLHFKLTTLTITVTITMASTTTDQKIARYAELQGTILVIELQKTQFGLGLFLAGNRDRSKMSVFVCGIHPRGSAHKDGRIQVGDEILEVNGNILYGRCHLNASAVINTSGGPIYEIMLLRRENAIDDMAVKPLTQFPVHLHEDELMGVEEEEEDVESVTDEEDNELLEAAGLATVSSTTTAEAGTSAAICSSSPSQLGKQHQFPPQQQHLKTESRHSPSLQQHSSSPSPHNLPVQVIEAELNKKSGKGLGLCLSSKVPGDKGGTGGSERVFVSKLIKGGVAELDGKIMEGDYILEVNGKDTRQSTHEEVVLLLKVSVFHMCQLPFLLSSSQLCTIVYNCVQLCRR